MAPARPELDDRAKSADGNILRCQRGLQFGNVDLPGQDSVFTQMPRRCRRGGVIIVRHKRHDRAAMCEKLAARLAMNRFAALAARDTDRGRHTGRWAPRTPAAMPVDIHGMIIATMSLCG